MSSIELKNVSLDYIVRTGTMSIKKAVIGAFQSKLSKKPIEGLNNTSFRALTDLNLKLEKGDRVGLLGKNGAGKSTLLRVLAKIYQPTVGKLTVKGNISTLFDINLGLNPEATGYENIVMLGIMRGLSKAQARALIPDVEAFTELKGFLHAPVRTYSSGMQMKLAFAVATAAEPQILLIDEVIGVGDAFFMKKATARLNNIIEKSHILVLTSHSDDIIRQFCDKVIVLDAGRVQFMGGVEEGVGFYEGMTA